MAKCDICDAHVDADSMKQLLGSYRSWGVVDVCNSCAKKADKIKLQNLDLSIQKTKEDIKALKKSEKAMATKIKRPFIKNHFFTIALPLLGTIVCILIAIIIND